jgi:pentatricopeptide repeat protein
VTHRLTEGLSRCQAYSTLGDREGAEGVVERMLAHGIRPDEKALCALLETYAGRGDVGGARKVLARMHEGGCASERAYGLVVRAYAALGDVDGAEGVVNEAITAGLTPRRRLYTELMRAYALRGHVEGAEDVLRRCTPVAGVEPRDPLLWNLLLQAYLHAGSAAGVEAVEAKMRALTLPLNEVSRTQLSRFRGEVLPWGREPRGPQGPRADAIMRQMEACCHQNDVRGAQELLQEAMELGGRPSLRQLNSLLNALATGGDTAGAEALLARMKGGGALPAPDLASFNALLKCYGAKGDVSAGEAGLRRIEEYGYWPDVVSYTTVLHAYVKRADVTGAEALFARMRQRNCSPNANTFVSPVPLLPATSPAGFLLTHHARWPTLLRAGHPDAGVRGKGGRGTDPVSVPGHGSARARPDVSLLCQPGCRACNAWGCGGRGGGDP